MGRAPFPTTPGASAAGQAHTAAGVPGGAAMAAARPGAAAVTPRRDDGRRTLVVGHGISVQGSVQDAERLVVEGTVESNMIKAKELIVTAGGLFRGEVEVDDAEIGGTVDGTLTVRGSLTVVGSGRLMGKAVCGRLKVEDGGQITGQIEMLTMPSAPVEAPKDESAA